MVIAKIMVSGANAKVVKTSTITKGMIGAEIEITYEDPMWENMDKTVVFRGLDAKAVVDAGNKVTIPAEVLGNAGLWLMVSVLGVEPETGMQIPTPWVSLGLIQEAAGDFL